MNSIYVFLGIFILTICLKSYLCKEYGHFDTNDVPEQILEWVKELQRLDQEIKDSQSSSPLTINKLKALATSQQRRQICQQNLELLVRHFLQRKAQLVASLLKVNEDDRENFVQAVLQLFENLIKSQNTVYPTTTGAVTATATTTSTTTATIPSSTTTTLNTSSTEDIQTTSPMVVTNSTPDATTTSASTTELMNDFGNGIDEY